MGKFVTGLVIGVVATLATVSVVQGWLPRGEDSAFLVMSGVCLLTSVVWFILGLFIDNTNGNDNSIIAMFMVAAAAILATIFVPIAVAFGAAWATSIYVGCGVIAVGVVIGSWIISGN